MSASATWPSGKAEVCKTFIRGFESHRRLSLSDASIDSTAMSKRQSSRPAASAREQQPKAARFATRAAGPLSNYTLSSVCPACESKTFKLACKVRCAKCGFMWDCSEL